MVELPKALGRKRRALVRVAAQTPSQRAPSQREDGSRRQGTCANLRISPELYQASPGKSLGTSGFGGREMLASSGYMSKYLLEESKVSHFREAFKP